MPYYHIYLHYKQEGKDTIDYIHAENYNRQEVSNLKRKFENGDMFLFGGYMITSDSSHIKKIEIWETKERLSPPIDWNNMWRIGEQVTRLFITSIPLDSKNVEAKHTLVSQIFISHSKEDKDLVETYRSYFDDTYVKPFFASYERWSRRNMPNWQWINQHIMESDALLVILTKHVADTPQTRNWVSYEIGVASACKPPKPVYVCREESVDFPIPYFNHYLPYPHPPKNIMRAIILDPTDESKTPKAKCSKCKMEFCYHGTHFRFRCPCCNNTIDWKYRKLHSRS